MANFNKLLILGNLTRDVEMRFTPRGMAVGKFGVAINRRWRTEAGEEKEEVTFVDCEIWSKSAETLSQYARKGDPIFLECRLAQETWDDKQTGQKRSKMKAVVESFQFLKPKSQSADEPAARPAAAAGRSRTETGGGDKGGYEDEEPPF